MARGPSVVAVLLAAGSGRRAGGRKQFRSAGGRTLLEWACAPFVASAQIGAILVVAPAAELTRARRAAARACGDKLLDVIAGGSTRHLSSRAAVAALPESTRFVLIHDVARPFASSALIGRVLRATRTHGAAIPVLPVSDSILETAAGEVGCYLDRAALRSVQTPQGFLRSELAKAFAHAAKRQEDFTDDASALVALGQRVHCVPGELGNYKITRHDQLQAALRQLAARR